MSDKMMLVRKVDPMKTSIPRLLWVGIVAAVALPAANSQTSHEALLDRAESRLRAIYERDEFRPKRFRAEWLADSSGYTVLESVPGATEKVRASYDVASGKRTVLSDSEEKAPSRSGQRSPDGASVLISERGNLYVRHANDDRKIPLTKSVPDGPVSNRDAVWSPDGKWIAFVQ
jgi:dipeptidyl-peptidase-4